MLEDFTAKSIFQNHGERVVTGQHLMQASSDIFLGWLRAPGGVDGISRDFYGRQLKDWKGSFEAAGAFPRGMGIYGRLCGWTLARAHARSGDRIAIAAYMGSGDVFDRAIADFSIAYADQTNTTTPRSKVPLTAGEWRPNSGSSASWPYCVIDMPSTEALPVENTQSEPPATVSSLVRATVQVVQFRTVRSWISAYVCNASRATMNVAIRREIRRGSSSSAIMPSSTPTSSSSNSLSVEGGNLPGELGSWVVSAKSWPTILQAADRTNICVSGLATSSAV